MLVFLARYKAATYTQLAQLFNTDSSNIRHRMADLEKKKLVAIYRGGIRKNILTATVTGMRLVGWQMPPYTPKHASIAHTLALTDLGVIYESQGHTVVTEREIRAAWVEGQTTDRTGLADEWADAAVTYAARATHADAAKFVIPPAAGKDKGHRIPDMVLVSDNPAASGPSAIAIEMELSVKDSWRYKDIVDSYITRGRTQFANVLYLTPYRDVASAITSAIKSKHAEAFITVKHFDPPTDLGWD